MQKLEHYIGLRETISQDLPQSVIRPHITLSILCIHAFSPPFVSIGVFLFAFS